MTVIQSIYQQMQDTNDTITETRLDFTRKDLKTPEQLRLCSKAYHIIRQARDEGGVIVRVHIAANRIGSLVFIYDMSANSGHKF